MHIPILGTLPEQRIALSAIVPFVVSFVLGMLVYKDSDYEYLNDVVETDIKSVSKEEKTEEKKKLLRPAFKRKRDARNAGRRYDQATFRSGR